MARSTNDVARTHRLVTLIRQSAYIDIVEVDQRIITTATELAIQYHIRGYDAVYVALAQLRNAVLITLDQEQRQCVPSTVVACTPAEELALLLSVQP